MSDKLASIIRSVWKVGGGIALGALLGAELASDPEAVEAGNTLMEAVIAIAGSASVLLGLYKSKKAHE
jgi:hypothetical protein